MKSKKYIIGTRGSLLALTQCEQIKSQLEEKTGASFELKVIRTEGDENTTKALWQMDGKDFFTKELDNALLGKEIDMVVHSYKDLGSERPEGIKLSAIAKRHYAHDILLITNETKKRLQNKELCEFVVGTSSPRRMTNISSSLRDFLPYAKEMNLSISTKNLRGNVNSRIEKLLANNFDAIVLAMPGIERLAQGFQNDDCPEQILKKFGLPQEVLKKLCRNLSFMILPTSEFPAAASQGALGIECLDSRDDNGELEKIINSVHCEHSAQAIKHERKIFSQYGGGCHLALGVTADYGQYHLRLSSKGEVDRKKIETLSVIKRDESENVNIKDFTTPTNEEASIFIGMPSHTQKERKNIIYDEIFTKEPQSISKESLINKDIFIAGPSALKMALNHLKELKDTDRSRLFCSGVYTWKKMAAHGLWCNASSDALGEQQVVAIRNSHIVQAFFGTPNWLSLTSTSAKSEHFTTCGVYKKRVKESPNEYSDKVKNTHAFFWTNPTQYQYYKDNFQLKEDAYHFCGLGKTYAALKNEQIKLYAVSSVNEFKEIFKIK